MQICQQKGQLSPPQNIAFLAFLGMATHTAFSPYYMWLILPFTVGILAYLSQHARTGTAFLYGYAFGFFLQMMNFAWTWPIITYGQNSPVTWQNFLVPAYLALFTSLTAGSFSYISKKYNMRTSASLLFATLWTCAEMMQSYMPVLAMPWNLMGYATVSSLSLVQAASLGSVHFLSFLSVLVSVMFLYGWALKKIAHTALALSILALWYIYGDIRLNTHPITYAEAPLKVRIIQTGIHLSDTNLHSPLAFIKANSALSKPNNSADIYAVIWPEWGAPTDLKHDPAIRGYMSKYLLPEQFLITGSESTSPQGKRYNSLSVLHQGEVISTHNKSMLIPFAEYIPDHWMTRFISAPPFFKDTLQGTGIKAISLPKLTFTPLICFEALNPIDVAKQRSNALIQISNDYWLKNTPAYHQMFTMSKLRAIETGKPLIRAANTGVSALIDPFGRTLKHIPHQDADVLDVYIPEPTPTLWEWVVQTLQTPQA